MKQNLELFYLTSNSSYLAAMLNDICFSLIAIVAAILVIFGAEYIAFGRSFISLVLKKFSLQKMMVIGFLLQHD